MTISQAGIDFIKDWEKFSPVAYPDQGGVWTIGYGTTGGVKPGDKITEPEAFKELWADILSAQEVIHDNVVVGINQNQFDALVAFIYNIGETAFRNSTALKLINAGKLKDVPAQMMRWNKIRINNKVIVSKGLTNRRAAEVSLFNKPIGES